jgi:hypothetical protein
LDWIEDGVRYHLLAHSKDGGLTYQGNYGMFRPEEQWTIELIRRIIVDHEVEISGDQFNLNVSSAPVPEAWES